MARQEGVDPAQALIETGMAVIGTPRDAIKQTRRLQEDSGGFGSFLQMAQNWANWEQTRKSYELFARFVAPVIQDRNQNRAASYKWTARNHDRFMEKAGAAIGKEIEKDEKEKDGTTEDNAK